MVKTFFNLVQEVQKPGLCHRCGGCVTLCTALNYGALVMDKDGRPAYGDVGKCIECGLCYSICPEIKDLDEEIRRKAAWGEPMGRIIETTVVRSTDPAVRSRATDGGAVTALLLHLFDRNRIDGAIVARAQGRFRRRPFLATTREEILKAPGPALGETPCREQSGSDFLAFSAIMELDTLLKQGLSRVALVGTPCQIKSLRKMQVLNLAPADAVRFCFGIFCQGNFTVGPGERETIARLAGTDLDDIVAINLREQLLLTLGSGEVRAVELDRIGPMKHKACRYCSDYSAEFADISFGGVGAAMEWTTVIARTPLGRDVLADSRGTGAVEQYPIRDNPGFASKALRDVRRTSTAKRKSARDHRRRLQGRKIRLTR